MKCVRCGYATSPGGRFCGKCGQSIEEGTAGGLRGSPPKEPIEGLQERLVELSRLLGETGTPEYLTKAIDILARGPNAAGGHLTAIIGEKGRGKTTLINRLLGSHVLPTGRNGYRTSVVVQVAPEWSVMEASEIAVPTNLPVASGLALDRVQGPAAVLGSTTLLDTPPLNEVGLDFEERVVADLLHADAFLICVAANQLLSQNERDLIRQRLLPLLSGEGALVVTHTDAIETDSDWKDVSSRAQRFAGNKLGVLFLPADRKQAPMDVLRFIGESAERRLTQRSSLWRRKVIALVSGIAEELEVGMGHVQPLVEVLPSREERLEGLIGLLESEQRLALAEAEASLRESLSELRMALSERAAHWSPDYAQYEGVSEISADVEAACRDAVQRYVSTLEASLTSHVPRSLQVAAEGLSVLAPSPSDLSVDRSPPPPVAVALGRDKRVLVLRWAGAGLLLATGPLALAAGAGALVISHRWMQQQDAAFSEQVKVSVVEALAGWITTAELQIVEQLRKETAPVLTSLTARVEAIVDAAPPPLPVSSGGAILAKVRECLAHASRDALFVNE